MVLVILHFIEVVKQALTCPSFADPICISRCGEKMTSFYCDVAAELSPGYGIECALSARNKDKASSGVYLRALTTQSSGIRGI